MKIYKSRSWFYEGEAVISERELKNLLRIARRPDQQLNLEDYQRLFMFIEIKDDLTLVLDEYKEAEQREDLQDLDEVVKPTKTSTKKKENVKSVKNVKADEPKSFKDAYKKENTYQKLIAILKDKNIDNLGCNSINYCLNTYFNKGKFTTKQADLTPEQLEDKNNWIEENINEIKKFNSTEEIIEFIADALMTFGSEQQQKQLNYSLNYVRKNG